MANKMGAPIAFSDSENIVAQTRRKLGLSQVDFARLIGLTPGAISQFENGKREISGPVNALCKILFSHPDMQNYL